MDNSIHVRITPNDKFKCQAIIDYFLTLPCEFIIMEEGGSNNVKLHFHIHVVTEFSVERLRARLKKHFSIKGNSYLNLSEDKGKSLFYAIKNFKIRYNNLLTEQQIEDLKERQHELYDKKLKSITFSEGLIQNYKCLETTCIIQNGYIADAGNVYLHPAAHEIHSHIKNYIFSNLKNNQKTMICSKWIRNLYSTILFKYYSNTPSVRKLMDKILPFEQDNFLVYY